MIGSSPAQASTEPFWSAAQPSACWRTSTVTSSSGDSPAVLERLEQEEVRVGALGGGDLLALEVRDGGDRRAVGTTMAAHSGCEKMSMTWIGEPFERARSAAEPAVEPTSIASCAQGLIGLVRAGRLDPVDGHALVGEGRLEPALVLDDEAERVVGREVDVEGAALGDHRRPAGGRGSAAGRGRWRRATRRRSSSAAVRRAVAASRRDAGSSVVGVGWSSWCVVPSCVNAGCQ